MELRGEHRIKRFSSSATTSSTTVSPRLTTSARQLSSSVVYDPTGLSISRLPSATSSRAFSVGGTVQTEAATEVLAERMYSGTAIATPRCRHRLPSATETSLSTIERSPTDPLPSVVSISLASRAASPTFRSSLAVSSMSNMECSSWGTLASMSFALTASPDHTVPIERSLDYTLPLGRPTSLSRTVSPRSQASYPSAPVGVSVAPRAVSPAEKFEWVAPAASTSSSMVSPSRTARLMSPQRTSDPLLFMSYAKAAPRPTSPLQRETAPVALKTSSPSKDRGRSPSRDKQPSMSSPSLVRRASSGRPSFQCRLSSASSSQYRGREEASRGRRECFKYLSSEEINTSMESRGRVSSALSARAPSKASAFVNAAMGGAVFLGHGGLSLDKRDTSLGRRGSSPGLTDRSQARRANLLGPRWEPVRSPPTKQEPAATKTTADACSSEVPLLGSRIPGVVLPQEQSNLPVASGKRQFATSSNVSPLKVCEEQIDVRPSRFVPYRSRDPSPNADVHSFGNGISRTAGASSPSCSMRAPSPPQCSAGMQSILQYDTTSESTRASTCSDAAAQRPKAKCDQLSGGFLLAKGLKHEPSEVCLQKELLQAYGVKKRRAAQMPVQRSSDRARASSRDDSQVDVKRSPVGVTRLTSAPAVAVGASQGILCSREVKPSDDMLASRFSRMPDSEAAAVQSETVPELNRPSVASGNAPGGSLPLSSSEKTPAITLHSPRQSSAIRRPSQSPDRSDRWKSQSPERWRSPVLGKDSRSTRRSSEKDSPRWPNNNGLRSVSPASARQCREALFGGVG